MIGEFHMKALNARALEDFKYCVQRIRIHLDFWRTMERTPHRADQSLGQRDRTLTKEGILKQNVQDHHSGLTGQIDQALDQKQAGISGYMLQDQH